MKKFAGEFRDFIAQGNIIDMAVGVIIGGAFGKIVASLVDDIIMPLIGILLGGVDFTNLFYALDGNDYATIAQAQEAGSGVLSYGIFIQNIIDFLIIALVIFLAIKQFAKLRGQLVKEEAEEEEAVSKQCPYCKTDIPVEAVRCPHCTSQLEG